MHIYTTHVHVYTLSCTVNSIPSFFARVKLVPVSLDFTPGSEQWPNGRPHSGGVSHWVHRVRGCVARDGEGRRGRGGGGGGGGGVSWSRRRISGGHETARQERCHHETEGEIIHETEGERIRMVCATGNSCPYAVCCMTLQALQEFSTLCEREPVEAVVAVLNIWNLMYNKLSTVCTHVHVFK